MKTHLPAPVCGVLSMSAFPSGSPCAAVPTNEAVKRVVKSLTAMLSHVVLGSVRGALPVEALVKLPRQRHIVSANGVGESPI